MTLTHPTNATLVEYIARDLAGLEGLAHADTWDDPKFDRSRHLRRAETVLKGVADWSVGAGSELLVNGLVNDAGMTVDDYTGQEPATYRPGDTWTKGQS